MEHTVNDFKNFVKALVFHYRHTPVLCDIAHVIPRSTVKAHALAGKLKNLALVLKIDNIEDNIHNQPLTNHDKILFLTKLKS